MITAHNGPFASSRPGWAQLTTYQGGFSSALDWRGHEATSQLTSRSGGGRRGIVSEFSRASRRRLMRLIGTINRYGCSRTPALLTVTYPGVWLQKPPQVRANCRALIKRIRRKYGELAIIWRLEYQSRGAPHFHMLIFEPPGDECLRSFVQGAWYGIVGTENPHHRTRGTDLRPTHSWRGVVAYVSKYLAKLAPQGAYTPAHQGRFWGVECRESLKTAPVSFALTVKQGLQARRWLLRAANRRVRGTGPLKSARFLADSRLCERVARFLAPEVYSWAGHRRDPPGPLAWRAALGEPPPLPSQ